MNQELPNALAPPCLDRFDSGSKSKLDIAPTLLQLKGKRTLEEDAFEVDEALSALHVPLGTRRNHDDLLDESDQSLEFHEISRKLSMDFVPITPQRSRSFEVDPEKVEDEDKDQSSPIPRFLYIPMQPIRRGCNIPTTHKARRQVSADKMSEASTTSLDFSAAMAEARHSSTTKLVGNGDNVYHRWRHHSTSTINRQQFTSSRSASPQPRPSVTREDTLRFHRR